MPKTANGSARIPPTELDKLMAQASARTSAEVASIAARGLRGEELTEDERRAVYASALNQREPEGTSALPGDSLQRQTVALSRDSFAEILAERDRLKAENESLRAEVSWFKNKGTGNA